jgi:hypothetical protein
VSDLDVSRAERWPIGHAWAYSRRPLRSKGSPMAYAQLSRVRMQYFERGHGPEHVVFVHGYQASCSGMSTLGE